MTPTEDWRERLQAPEGIMCKRFLQPNGSLSIIVQIAYNAPCQIQ